jgi:hypothetical protein
VAWQHDQECVLTTPKSRAFRNTYAMPCDMGFVTAVTRGGLGFRV